MTSAPFAPRVDIIIPTFNRAHLICHAIDAALGQSWWNTRVTVIDDGSTDDTFAACEGYFDELRFSYIRLGRNGGTARAKNAGLLLTDGEAVTFHDSDDLPHRDKILMQVRALIEPNMKADECLNWQMAGRQAGEDLSVAAALVHHELILPDGRRVAIRKDLSLCDDVFPNLQMGSQVPGEWTHINSGLFRQELLQRNGGFADCIEEDREFRNRLILNGEIIRVIPELLLVKIETTDSLTQSQASGYVSTRRKADRQMVWARVDEWRRSGRIAPEIIDFANLEIAFVSNPQSLALRDLPQTTATRQTLSRIYAACKGGPLHETAAQ